MNKKVLVLVQTFEYAVDGYDVLAVFSNKQALDDYVKKVYHNADKDDDGDYHYKHYYNNKLYDEYVLLIHEVDLHEN